MKKTLLSGLLSLAVVIGHARTIPVKNIAELNSANKQAAAGDSIILQNGSWDNVTIKLDCKGSAGRPIVFTAETAGQVIITGNSKLLIGGSYIVVNGLYFTRGFAGEDAIIKFRTGKEMVANNCRVTNTVIDDYNNPKRMDDNYWVMLYGKNNRIDHCSFRNKKNMGVLMAVILDDERSRANFHSIDHNYFGTRLPLASNTGETIRVGVSEHCEFNSHTQIVDNFFEHCDGETEIISIKSGSNVIRNNLFKECQGSVVLRHGDNNTVENNIFLGNGKKGTGGVRVINKGQWVINNLFYQCRGEWFRSPLAVMNGVPNSPANRYVAVTDAVIANNSFIDCAPIGLCIGSDTERSVAPKDVVFLQNIFYNSKDENIYNSYDNIGGIDFSGNLVSNRIPQQLETGFTRSGIKTRRINGMRIPAVSTKSTSTIPAALTAEAKKRLQGSLRNKPGFGNEKILQDILQHAGTDCGASWFSNRPVQTTSAVKTVDAKDAAAVKAILQSSGEEKLVIRLTGPVYEFTAPLLINRNVEFTAAGKKPIQFIGGNSGTLMQVKAGYALGFKNISIDLALVTDLISTDTSGSCEHSNFFFEKAHFINLKGRFFVAAQSSIADDIRVVNCTFTGFGERLFDFTNETTNKGLYNVERLTISNNRFLDGRGQLLAMVRGGNDESTLGPDLQFTNNIISNCITANDAALVDLFGTQLSRVANNIFTNSNTGKVAVRFHDLVKAVHTFRNNVFTNSGRVIENKFVEPAGNVFK